MSRILFFLLIPFLGFGQSLSVEVDLLFKSKQFQKAERLLQAHVSNNSTDVEAIELLGDAYGYQERWDEAIVAYEKLVQVNPENADYHYKYGGSLGMKALENKLRAIGLIGGIKYSFTKAAELDPEHIDARWALVELYMQLPGIFGGSMKKSLQYANELEALSPVDGYLAKGYIYEYDDAPDMAETYYKRALDVGGSMTCYDKLTTFYENQQKPEKAIATIEKAAETHKRNALHYQIGKVCADYNLELDKGEHCLNIFIENHSVKDGVPIEWAYFRMAQIHKNKKDKVQALKWIDKALAIRSNFKQAKREKEKIKAL